MRYDLTLPGASLLMGSGQPPYTPLRQRAPQVPRNPIQSVQTRMAAMEREYSWLTGWGTDGRFNISNYDEVLAAYTALRREWLALKKQAGRHISGTAHRAT